MNIILISYNIQRSRESISVMYIYENENNYCELIGILCEELTFSHESFGEKFYKSSITVKRLSESSDIIRLIIPESVIKPSEPLRSGDFVSLSGQFRSYNNYSGDGNKLLLSVYVKFIKTEEETENRNFILLNGFVCKKPVYRVTPFGREITDVLLAVNRLHNKSDYIPCIFWGKNAKLVSEYNVGDSLKIEGRIQSREYQKKLSEDETVTKTAYEISVSRVETE